METGASDDDFRATTASAIVRAAAALQAVTGLLLLANGLQLWMMVTFFGALAVVPWAMIALAVLSIYCAAQVQRARAWAAMLGAGVAALVAIGVGAWLVTSFSSGLYSCLAFVVVPVAVASTVLAILAIGPARRATEIRKRLAASGIELGL